MQKRVLVTGASSGIGSAIAIQLAVDGFEVSINYNKNKEKAQQVLEQIELQGGKAQLLQFDVKNRQSTQAILEKDLTEHGIYYGIVSNAGINADAAMVMMSDEDWDSVIDTNLNGFYNVVKPLLMPMISSKQGGRIIAISSVSGIMGNRGQVNYAAAKGALNAAVKSLAIELGKRKITVNAIAPGLIQTPMAHLEDTILQQILRQIPAARLGQPQEVANLASFLMSDKASYITRQIISIDGGLL